tara:strand:- start:636 stop:1436 length:801 start_codon:yes stop_codon:yes gene_type:complete
MSNFSDFISGDGSASFPTIFLHNSQTWVPPQDGNIMIHVIGGGGSGCASTASTTIESGAAGGYCRKNSLAVTTSGTFTVIIGAGGASVFGAAGAGTIGGTTSVAGTGLPALRGFGGAGGAVAANAYTTGGVATGGDVNYTGGRGGYQKGGGAVGLTGTGNDGKVMSSYAFSYGGDCDILGDFYSSSLGQLSGGMGGTGLYSSTDGLGGNREAEPLAGAGSMVLLRNNLTIGHASIGGGGGWSYSSSVTKIFSGRGGEGCVVIQYIP